MEFSRINFENQTTANAYDDLPLWSAKPGMLLLDNLKLEKNIKILDIGCGTGFPTIEIAQRVGNTTTIYGLDPWEKGIQKAKEKANNKGILNVEFINGISQDMPFKSEFFNKIISNNAFNGKNGSINVFKECYRVLKTNGDLCFTAILPSSMKSFYKLLIKVLKEEKIKNAEEIVNNHINQKRSNINKYKKNLKEAKLSINKIKKASFKINFTDEESVFNYYFFRLNFVESWLSMIPKDLQNNVIKTIKEKIRNEIFRSGKFSIKINYIYISAIK